MFATIRTHVRHHIVAYVALFFALGGTAWANHETIFSDDIVDGQVRTPDLGGNAVRSGKIEDGQVRTADVFDNNLTGADVLGGSLGAVDIGDSAFASDDIRDVVPFDRKQFGLPADAVESSEIENGTVTGSDLATSARPTAYVAQVDDTGEITGAGPGSTEGTLTLPPGTYVLSAKIVVHKTNGNLGKVICGLHVAGTRRDESEMDLVGSLHTDGTLPLQSVNALPSGGDAKVLCSDNGEGDLDGTDLKIIAIQIGSIG